MSTVQEASSIATAFELDRFTVSLESPGSRAELVSELSFGVRLGETLCIVGESGSGKTVAMQAATRLLEHSSPVRISGHALFDGQDLAAAPEAQARALRARHIGMVFQDFMEALNPTRRIGPQLIEASDAKQKHREVREGLRAKALSLLSQVGITDPEACFAKYPHQLSGGMQQRVLIAMALMTDPEVLVADEPTTALDVTIQLEILRLLQSLQRERGMTLILITHDIGVAAMMADSLVVMYAGSVVESGPVKEVLERPRHPYTQRLLDCVPTYDGRRIARFPTIEGSVPAPTARPDGCVFQPRCTQAGSGCDAARPPLVGGGHRVACSYPLAERRPPATVSGVAHHRAGGEARGEPILQLSSLSKTYRAKGRRIREVQALVSVSCEVLRGEFFGLVGESGSGKSTLGRVVAGLDSEFEGEAIVGESNLTQLTTTHDRLAFRRAVQVIFQDSSGSLDPRFTIGRSIEEPLAALTMLTRDARRKRAGEMLERVGLGDEFYARYPSELSGGQRQRVAIARAMAPRPQILVADEPTSALDVSVQASVMNLITELQREESLTVLFITHNIELVLATADRIGVMTGGCLVETGTPSELFHTAAHPYTRRLLASTPARGGDGGGQ